MPNHPIEYMESSGNIYQDLGFEDAEERLVKAKLAMRITEIIENNQFKQAEAAKILGINQPKISALMNGRLSGFSMEKLIHFLNQLNQDVEIIVKARKTKKLTAGKKMRRKNLGHLIVAFSS